MSGRSPLYDDPALAASYARVTASNAANAAYERPAVHALLGDVRDLEVLDAGCAAGEHAAWLLEHGARVVAVDGSAAMVRLARERLRERARVLHADLAKPLPLDDASFEVLLSSLTLHYLEDWSGPLREFARVLRPAGRLVFSIHHPFMTGADVENYHTVSLVEERWAGFAETPVPVRFYHRPLQRVVDDVLDAGFVVRGIREPQPGTEAHARDPRLAARFHTKPGFLIVDTEKRPR
ncbi:MAG TPA: class I SAM-dependent methyltransferase [Candidatus Elarobacter sp.]|jgi:SAM-dependent methyltransferase|nr:class I SAM-dependent methyltransferase [Candidatus Elarobacter sp.]